ncbi:MAG: dimethyl sulfoxide reductase anchor subunit [Alphaproteobacteria bacterium]|nr:dimethyl sulfoxide reductase anchor subunit [Alphaproteobacteria bacterium]
MHPAYSVIFFTTASGAGYGVLFLMGLLGPLGLLPANPVYCTIGLGVGLILVTAGLLSSTAHLGHPERAWRAFSQWRSSWLSREGVAAVLTYPPALIYGGLTMMDQMGPLGTLVGFSLAALAAITVVCTGMIYASLPTIQRWANGFTVPLYLLFMLATGAPILLLLTYLFGGETKLLVLISLAATLTAWIVKRSYWGWIKTEGAQSPATPESATGLGRFGDVRPVEAPHTAANFVMEEMGYRIARNRSDKLKRIAFLTGLGGSGAFLALGGLAAAHHTGVGIVCFLLATALALTATGIERWLFFAEARHVVTLYYGATRA